MNTIDIKVPINIAQMAVEATIIQSNGSIKSTEGRSREVERREAHVAEIVCAIIAKEFQNRKLLPYKPNNS